jgi:hypothetical protein
MEWPALSPCIEYNAGYPEREWNALMSIAILGIDLGKNSCSMAYTTPNPMCVLSSASKGHRVCPVRSLKLRYSRTKILGVKLRNRRRATFI